VAVILEVTILVLVVRRPVVATRFSARAIIRPAHRRASSRGANRMHRRCEAKADTPLTLKRLGNRDEFREDLHANFFLRPDRLTATRTVAGG
jgi:hypothetical protein